MGRYTAPEMLRESPGRHCSQELGTINSHKIKCRARKQWAVSFISLPFCQNSKIKIGEGEQEPPKTGLGLAVSEQT